MDGMGKIYVDGRGWLYRVMAGIIEDSYKARYRKPDMKGRPRAFSVGWKGVASLEWQKTQEAAEKDLEAYAIPCTSTEVQEFGGQSTTQHLACTSKASRSLLGMTAHTKKSRNKSMM